MLLSSHQFKSLFQERFACCRLCAPLLSVSGGRGVGRAALRYTGAPHRSSSLTHPCKRWTCRKYLLPPVLRFLALSLVCRNLLPTALLLAETGQRACVQRAKEIFKHSKQAVALVGKSQLHGEATAFVLCARQWQSACWLAAVEGETSGWVRATSAPDIGWSGC